MIEWIVGLLMLIAGLLGFAAGWYVRGWEWPSGEDFKAAQSILKLRRDDE